MESFLRDLQYAVRTLRKQPAFVLTVVLTLALGIGASAAMFGIVDAALLRPFPFRDAQRLTFVWGVAGPQRAIRGASHLEITDWGARNHTLQGISVYDEISLNLRTPVGADRVDAEMVSSSFFPLLGVSAQVGRVFLEEEDRTPDASPVAVISDKMWRTRYASDASIVGRAITLNDRAFTVVGVMPEGFQGASFDTDVWIPSMMISVNSPPSILQTRGNRWLGAIARLKDGVTLADAQRDLDAVARQLALEYPQSNKDRGAQLFSLRDNYLGSTKSLLLALLGAVGLFLLIGCANVISLQLVRATSRRREIALRIAIGAGRGRLVQQLVAEGIVLSVAGAIAGLLVAFWGLDALTRLAPDGVLPKYVNPTVDWRVLAFSLVLAVLCGIAFGLVPALRGGRVDLVGALKDGSRAASGGLGSLRRPGTQQLLVVAEIALALVLLAGAGLLVRSLQRQLAVDPGFRPDGVLTARITLPPQRYNAETRLQFINQLLERTAALPTARNVAVGTDLPFSSNNNAATIYVPVVDRELRSFRHMISPDYFATLGIPLRRGRAFASTDVRGTEPVVIVSDAMARRFWGDKDPIGSRLRLGSAQGSEVTIVGVAGTARFRDLSSDLSVTEPDVYFPLLQRGSNDLEIAVRSAGDAAQLAGALRREVIALDPGLPIFNVDLLGTMLHRQTATARFGSFVLTAFGGVAMLLAAIGIYGALAFLVSLGRREIAIRMALGATTSAVLGRIVGQGATLAIAGLVLGLMGATAATRAISSQLFGISRSDPATFVTVGTGMLLVALVASYIPARRAARVDPQLALKSE